MPVAGASQTLPRSAPMAQMFLSPYALCVSSGRWSAAAAAGTRSDPIMQLCAGARATRALRRAGDGRGARAPTRAGHRDGRRHQPARRGRRAAAAALRGGRPAPGPLPPGGGRRPGRPLKCGNAAPAALARDLSVLPEPLLPGGGRQPGRPLTRGPCCASIGNLSGLPSPGAGWPVKY